MASVAWVWPADMLNVAAVARLQRPYRRPSACDRTDPAFASNDTTLVLARLANPLCLIPHRQVLGFQHSDVSDVQAGSWHPICRVRSRTDGRRWSPLSFLSYGPARPRHALVARGRCRPLHVDIAARGHRCVDTFAGFEMPKRRFGWRCTRLLCPRT